MYSKEHAMDSSWFEFFGVDEVKEDNVMRMDVDNIESAQMSQKDMDVYKYSPVWEELILVECQYCDSHVLAPSIKKHVEMRHTGFQQYEKDPESSIFCKVKVEEKHSFPTVLSSTLTPRASTAGIHASRIPTSCSVDAFSAANQSPRTAEQFLGWPNSPHGAFQQSPLNMTTTNIVRVKSENSKMKVVIPPGYGGKMSTGVSILAKNHRSVLELPASIPGMQHEPYNQSFSFSSTPNIIPPTFALASSRDMPSTSYEMQSTSYEMPPSTSRGLLPCQPHSSSQTGLEGCLINSPVLQSSSTFSIGSLENPLQKAPALEKIVLRRVLQPDPKVPAEGCQSNQDIKRITKSRKDAEGNVFMVVKDKDRKKKRKAKAKLRIRKKKTRRVLSKAEEIEMKKLKRERSKLIEQLFQELQSVKKKLDQCNRSKKEIEKELSVVKADLEETKRTTDFRNEALQKKNEKFENEIQKLKLRNEELTNSLEQAQFYTQKLGNVWNFADNHMSKQFQTIEEQVELQKRIEELESESKELKHSSEVERRSFDDKLRHYFKIITELKKRYDEQVAKSRELRSQRDFYEQYLSPQVAYNWRRQLATLRYHQPEAYENFPGFLRSRPTPPIAPPTVPPAETPPAIDTQSVYPTLPTVDTQSVYPTLPTIDAQNVCPFPSQSSPENPEVLQLQQQPPQQEVVQEEEVS